MGIVKEQVEEITSLKQLLQVATEYGNQLKIKEKEEKAAAAKRKAEELVRKTLSQRTRANEYVGNILGKYLIPLENWKISKNTDQNFSIYLSLAKTLRLVYTRYQYRTGSPFTEKLEFHIKREGYYTSWDYPRTKPCTSWEEFCKVVATHGKNGNQIGEE